MFKIEATLSTPEISIELNVFKMSGICTAENPILFFSRFKEELYKALATKNLTILIFELDYYNSGTARCLMDLLSKIGLAENKAELKVFWKYDTDDEEMKESGELFAEVTGLEFNYVETN